MQVTELSLLLATVSQGRFLEMTHHLFCTDKLGLFHVLCARVCACVTQDPVSKGPVGSLNVQQAGRAEQGRA